MFPPTEEEPWRTRPVAGVFPPEEEEPRRVAPVAGVFPLHQQKAGETAAAEEREVRGSGDGMAV